MKKINILMTLLIFITLVSWFILGNSYEKGKIAVSTGESLSIETEIAKDEITSLYYEMRLQNKVNYDAFKQGVIGFNRIESKNKNILALVDFSRPSTEERMFILDLDKKEVLFVTHVSHGRNSGENYATSFSNINGSYQSSLGFFLTQNTYQGKNGYSLVLNGLEPGINDRARERTIVIHGASYSNPSIIASNGRLGRSLGCPAVPEKLAAPIIDTLKDGAVLYIFADNTDYMNQSSIL